MKQRNLNLFLMKYHGKNKGLPLTCGIANKGFCGMRSVIARFKLCISGYRLSPQFLTGHTAVRYGQP